MGTLIDILLDTNTWFLTIALAMPIAMAAVGAHISSKAGVINIGLEGIMVIGAFFGVLFNGFFLSKGLPNSLNLLITFSMVIGVGVLCGLFIGIFNLKFGADIGLTGIMFNLIASGLTVYLLYLFTGDRSISSSYPSIAFPTVNIPFIQHIPILGDIISGHNLLVYIGFAIILGLTFLLNKTVLGLRIRAVGESPDAVTSVGLNGTKLKLFAISMSGAFVAIGGMSLSMGLNTMFAKDMSSGRGFIGLTANTLGGTPIGAMFVSMIFGFADALATKLQILSNIPREFLEMLPYALTLIALFAYSFSKMTKESQIKDRNYDGG